MRRLPKDFIALLVTFFLSPSLVLAAGNLVVGLVYPEMEWKLFIQQEKGNWELFPTEEEPRTPVYSEESDLLVYADSRGNIRVVDKGVERVAFAASEEHTFTQPVFDQSGNQIYVVQLKQGSSVDTDVLIGDLLSGKTRKVISQRSAQFEPFVTDEHVYYNSVSCIPPACDRIIADIWRINPVSLVAEQLTALNAISKAPAVSLDGELYFISDTSGRFRLHRYSKTESTPLTPDVGTDSSPGVTASGDVIYINRMRSKPDTLKQWSDVSGQVSDIPTPQNVIKLRDFSTW